MQLRPSEIYFSQAEINNHFDKRSTHPYKNLGETLDELVEGRCDIYDIPKISVVSRGGKWVTADNRRLWVFRHLERLGKCTTIPVIQTSYIDPRKLNSTNGGRAVRFYFGKSAHGKWHSRVPSIDPSVPFVPQENEVNNAQTIPTSMTSFSNSDLFTSLRSRSSVYRDTMSETTDMFRSLQMNRFDSSSKLDPSEIRYTKESITINSYFEGLKNQLQVGSSSSGIKPVDVYNVYGKHWVTDGNKRLWSFKSARTINTNLRINADVKEDKDEFLDLMRQDRPYLSLIDILQSGETIQISY